MESRENASVIGKILFSRHSWSSYGLVGNKMKESAESPEHLRHLTECNARVRMRICDAGEGKRNKAGISEGKREIGYGEGNLGRQSNCRQQSDRGGGREPIFPARGGQ